VSFSTFLAQYTFLLKAPQKQSKKKLRSEPATENQSISLSDKQTIAVNPKTKPPALIPNGRVYLFSLSPHPFYSLFSNRFDL